LQVHSCLARPPVIPFSLKNIYFEAHHFLTSSSEKSGNAEF
jgi:hypothetical protein